MKCSKWEGEEEEKKKNCERKTNKYGEKKKG